MVWLLIDSWRNLNPPPPFLERGGTWPRTPSGKQGNYLKVPSRHVSGFCVCVVFVLFWGFFLSFLFFSFSIVIAGCRCFCDSCLDVGGSC